MPAKLNIEYVREQIEREGYIVLSDTYISAHNLIKLICPVGHYVELSWSKWKKGRRCKYCNGSRLYKDVVYEAFENEGYKILSINGSLSKGVIKFICPKGHVETTLWGRWVRGSRCRVCYVESLRTPFDEIKEKITAEGVKVLTIEDDYNNDGNILCSCTCGYEYYTTVNKWGNGHRCRVCGYRKLSEKYRHPRDYVSNALYTEGYRLLSGDYTNALTPIKVVCPKGHIVDIKWRDWQEGCRCSRCGLLSHISDGESQIASFIKSIGLQIETNDRTLISPLEIDIVIPDKKIAIEYCGLYWHSEACGKDKNYHLNKLIRCNEVGYRLITIFEDEWITKRTIVESKLLYLLGESTSRKIYARKCKVVEVTHKEASLFCENNHLQSFDIGNAVRIGLFYSDTLVSVMTLSKPSISKGSKNIGKGVWEISRFCTDTGLIVVGGFSRLLSYFKRNYEWSAIFSYVDLRWFTGDSYEKVGFSFVHRTKPNYWYCKGSSRKHRFALRKKEITEETELSINTSKGYNRIWDCGNLKYIIKNEKGILL